MSRFVYIIIITLSVTSGFASDQGKAEQQARKITAMATDKTGRSMVSMSLADVFKVPRPLLVQERRRLNLDYGSFFIAHCLLAGNMKISDLTTELAAGKTVWQIGDEQHVNWGKVAGDAKKENSRIEDYIYRHFLNKKNTETDQARDFVDKYDPAHDAVRTDFSVTPQEMLDAQARFIFWRDQAGKTAGGATSLSHNDRLAANMDHADTIHNKDGTIMAPAAGGIPSR